MGKPHPTSAGVIGSWVSPLKNQDKKVHEISWKHAGKSKGTYFQTFWLLLAFERSVLDDNIWQQLDYSLQLNNSRKGTWSAAFTITVIIEFLRTHEGRVDCKKAVPMALFKHDCSPHLHCIHPPAQGWHWACFKWSSNKLRACSSSWLLHHDFGGPTYIKDTTVGYRLDHYPAIFCSRCDSSQGWPPVQLMAPWAILSLCVMVSSHASEFFRRVRLCFSKDLFLWKQLLL